MELRFGSVMLLLSCSLHQSLWGILASVPNTEAKKCKHKLSDKGEPVKKVQMIRRIPARCSGWEEAWSWISKKDCRTKYVLDYVELPSAVHHSEQEDCEEEMSVPAPSSQFDFTNEKFLAITFGAATLALLILVLVIVVSVIRRGSHRCSLCGRGPTYSTASVNDVDSACEVRASCNPYVDGTQDDDHVYEEIFDKSKLSLEEGIKYPGYQNCVDDVNDKDNGKLVNGVHQRRPVTPSAPFEEDLGLTARKTVPNEYSVFDDTLVKSVDDAKEVNECESNDVDRNIDYCTKESSNDMPQSSESENEQNYEEMDLSSLEDSNVTKNALCERNENEYTEFESVVLKEVLDIESGKLGECDLDQVINTPENDIELEGIGDNEVVDVSQSDEYTANASNLITHSDTNITENVVDKTDTQEIVESHDNQIEITENSTLLTQNLGSGDVTENDHLES